MPTKLGQNFLHDKGVVKKIIDSANLSPDDVVIEIGPGKGVLTEEFAKRVKKVIAIEIDEMLSNLLRNKFSNNKNVEIITADILKIDLRQLLLEHSICHSERSPAVGGINSAESKNLIREKLNPSTSVGMTHCNYKVIANLPYYITSPIIRLLLEAEFPPKEMVLMVQKEVAERIIAKPGKMSILALSVQYYAEPELLFYVSKASFFPVPEVDSVVIRITCNTKRAAKNKIEMKQFFRIVRAGFSAKRKVLVNNLANSFHLDKKEVEEKIKKAGISPVSRAQELSIDHWKKLMKKF